MRELIVTDLTRFNRDDEVCTAALDPATGECFRPLPYLRTEMCEELNIHPGAIIRGQFSYQAHRERPHIEDADYSELDYVGPCSGEQFRSVLENSVSNSVSEGFDFQFSQGQKVIPRGQASAGSIITIKIRPAQLRIFEDDYKPGRIKASITDDRGDQFRYLPITDLGFYNYAQRHQDDGRLNEVTDFIEGQEEIYLRIGLSRAYSSPDGRNGYWLQVNGIYTFPYFYEEVRSYG